MTKGNILDNVDLQLNEIQGNILAGFNKDYQALLFLSFSNADGARSWLQQIAPEIATTDEVDTFNMLFKELNSRRCGELGILKVTWTNIAFTHAGLRVLGASGTDRFPDDFKQGMRGRAGQIGDAGASAPANWIGAFKDGGVHAVLIVASDSQSDLHQHVMRYAQQIYLAPGVDILLIQEGAVRTDDPGHEHFGFKDGVSQPGVKGFTPSKAAAGSDAPHQGVPGQDLLWPGEFVLGYPTQIPSMKAGFDGPNPDPGPVSASGPDWTKNGSYLVFRRLRQDVDGFRQMVADGATQAALSPDVFGAKLVGRYKSGCPVELPDALNPTAGDPSVSNPDLLSDDKINDFEYDEDLDGAKVPRAAHIRKAYPRNEVFLDADGKPLPPDASPLNESTTQTHRIMRRGIPFGTSFRPSLGTESHGPKDVNDPADRGLLFLCYQRSVFDQFEFIQTVWVNNGDFPQQGDGEDPIISQSAQGPFRCPVAGKAKTLSLAHFVTTTGGEYFFQPSISALKDLSTGKL